MSTKPSTGRPDSLLAYDIARLTRSGRPASLVHRPLNPRQKRMQVWSSRLNDGHLWANAAWAEVMGLEPVVRWRTLKGEQREVRPWRNGAESALTYLQQMLDSPFGKGMARQRLARLAAHGKIEDSPRYHRKQQEV